MSRASMTREGAIARARAHFDGGGYGHGVGMCQYGCQGLARQGHDYQEILSYYYPGSLLARLW